MTATSSRPTQLRDLKTGSTHTRWTVGEVVMTTEILEHPYSNMLGKAFVTLRQLPVVTDDSIWGKVVGANVTLFGGVEIDIDEKRLTQAITDMDGCDLDFDDIAQRRPDLVTVAGGQDLLVPIIVNDIDYPPMRGLVRLNHIGDSTQMVDVGHGYNARGGANVIRSEHTCDHSLKRDGYVAGCRCCMRRFWTARAMTKGVIRGQG